VGVIVKVGAVVDVCVAVFVAVAVDVSVITAVFVTVNVCVGELTRSIVFVTVTVGVFVGLCAVVCVIVIVFVAVCNVVCVIVAVAVFVGVLTEAESMLTESTYTFPFHTPLKAPGGAIFIPISCTSPRSAPAVPDGTMYVSVVHFPGCRFVHVELCHTHPAPLFMYICAPEYCGMSKGM
jgi:hypothetical protein